MDVREALQAIADKRTPCRVCKKPHSPRPIKSTNMAPTWSDPEDGHPYSPMAPDDFARVVLEINR